ncbi:unnamed protein product [Brachionus calyciflorus]|uniref:Uncharacterized protein n=1 Tax=Brachionus calyciflorus TaxID=104777 RepID=A0A814HYY9_9BILA|nr:unnamed protein product [Brachionus calyciflorus]
MNKKNEIERIIFEYNENNHILSTKQSLKDTEISTLLYQIKEINEFNNFEVEALNQVVSEGLYFIKIVQLKRLQEMNMEEIKRKNHEIENERYLFDQELSKPNSNKKIISDLEKEKIKVIKETQGKQEELSKEKINKLENFLKESQDKQLTLEETIENLEGYLKISENQVKIFLSGENF